MLCAPGFHSDFWGQSWGFVSMLVLVLAINTFYLGFYSQVGGAWSEILFVLLVLRIVYVFGG